MLLDEPLTRKVIAAFFSVYNEMGIGFLEHVYVGALAHECEKVGMRITRELPVPVYYDGVIVGTYRVDLMVEDRVVVEVKCGKGPRKVDLKQLQNYLRSTQLELGLLLYFGTKPVIKRFVMRNPIKREIAGRTTIS